MKYDERQSVRAASHLCVLGIVAGLLTLLILSMVGPPVAPSLPLRVSTTLGHWAELERETYARVQRMGEVR